MKIFLVALVLSATTFSQAGWFAKKPLADKDGNCLPEVIKENARVFGEMEKIDKLAVLSETQAKSKVKETQKLGEMSFKDLGAKVKALRTAIETFNKTYADGTCKAMLKAGPSAINVKETMKKNDEYLLSVEKMAESWLKSFARK